MKKIKHQKIKHIKHLTHDKVKARGGTLVEALVAAAVLSIVLVSILSGFAGQQASTRKNTDKNTAILMGEARLEELLKFPADQLTTETYVDYILQKGTRYEIYDENAVPPTAFRQFRRTTNIILDPKGQIAYIRVLVEYGARGASVTGNTWTYPYKVGFSTRRMLK